MSKAVGVLRAVLVGTGVAFLASLSRPIVDRAAAYLRSAFSQLSWVSIAELGLISLSLFSIGLLVGLPRKVWASLRLGLIPFDWFWALAVATAWVAYERGYTRVAVGSLAAGVLVILVVRVIRWRTEDRMVPDVLRFLQPDLPVPEDGEDLLGRRELVETLVSTILVEQPAIIAVTGRYGEGKTSFLNFTVGELNKSREIRSPIVVRFSPWLAGDSNELVLSLLNSVVAEVSRTLLVPGLSGDAARYARTLLSAVPRVERLKDLFAEPSQEGRIDALVRRISSVRRRLLVVLDDLDRMEAKELETVLKVLRGSDKLTNVTFLCAFDKAEVAKILTLSRPHQDASVFVEKFFPLEVPLPEISSSQLHNLFSERIGRILKQNALPDSDLSTNLDKMWDDGAGSYFRNFRRIKIFVNRISRSLARIAGEVNVEDFIRLELIRDMEPGIYDKIFRNPQFFWNQNLAFEVRFRGSEPLGEDEAKKWRAEFYERSIEASLPEQNRYVLQLLGDLFPHFAAYRTKRLDRAVGAVEAEKERRIFHPRNFPQYFTLKVPSELFPRREFEAFLSTVRNANEDEAIAVFNTRFRSLEKEEFKRWHFMHLIESDFGGISLSAQRGLVRGMAQNSSDWQTDAFELLIAISSTREVLEKIPQSENRKDLLESIVRESASDLYTLVLLRRIEYDLSSVLAENQRFKVAGLEVGGADFGAALLSDLQQIKRLAAEHIRTRYDGADPPSVFEQFSFTDAGINRIEPNLFLFNWQWLGTDAQADERKYLHNLLTRRPQDLNKFLALMFRVDFIDDYAQLKPLIDYKELSGLITLHEGLLDAEKVNQFRERYSREQG